MPFLYNLHYLNHLLFCNKLLRLYQRFIRGQLSQHLIVAALDCHRAQSSRAQSSLAQSSASNRLRSTVVDQKKKNTNRTGAPVCSCGTTSTRFFFFFCVRQSSLYDRHFVVIFTPKTASFITSRQRLLFGRRTVINLFRSRSVK